MKESNDNDQKKKRIPIVKTFAVPFLSGEKNKIDSIFTNISTKTLRENIIRQALKLHSQGNILEAKRYYQLFINKGFIDPIIFSNYGVILKDSGNYDEAEILQRKAIKLNPYFVAAYSNLGSLLRDIGKLNESETLLRKAIELQPNFSEAHYNLGNTLSEIFKFKEAEISFRKAIEIQPDFHEAHYNLGNILHDVGKLKEAFDSYLKVIELNPRNSDIYNSITKLLRDSDLSQYDKFQLNEIFNLLLEKSHVSHNDLFNVFNFLYNDELIDYLKRFESNFYKEDSLEKLINHKSIIIALKRIIFKDIRLERMLIKARKQICDKISEDKVKINSSTLEFIIALGEQCFNNEYVYSFTYEEKLSINKIINRCILGRISEINISILACYFPLYKLLDQITCLKSFNSSNKSFKDLMDLQIFEPLKEKHLTKNIKKLGSINDTISQKVKYQYEENPYPRWRYINPLKDNKFSMNQVINTEIRPNHINFNLDNRKLKILIAGCGTGKQILQSQRYKNSQITAIDLSSSSLSYAQRKINELQINNVKLIQMDILEVHLLEEQFDIIECGGVLHHMDDPSKGLKALLCILKNSGFLKLGLYSELARMDIVNARKYIETKKIQTNLQNIRNFREQIILNNLNNLYSLTTFSDFYTLSECRDLCFHIQEHRFTIELIKEIINSNHLKFLGFLLPKQVKSIYGQYFPEDNLQINLENWSKFENKYPNTFREMYQFWVSKLK